MSGHNCEDFVSHSCPVCLIEAEANLTRLASIVREEIGLCESCNGRGEFRTAAGDCMIFPHLELKKALRQLEDPSPPEDDEVSGK